MVGTSNQSVPEMAIDLLNLVISDDVKSLFWVPPKKGWISPGDHPISPKV